MAFYVFEICSISEEGPNMPLAMLHLRHLAISDLISVFFDGDNLIRAAAAGILDVQTYIIEVVETHM